MATDVPTTTNVKRIVAIFELARMRREMERRRQQVDELFSTTSVVPATSSPAPSAFPSSPSFPTTPPAPTTTASTSIDTTKLDFTTKSEPLHAPPARCSTPGRSHGERALAPVTVVLASPSTLATASSASYASLAAPATSPTRCSTICLSSNVETFKTVNTFTAIFAAPPMSIHFSADHEWSRFRYTVNSTTPALSCGVRLCLDTKVVCEVVGEISSQKALLEPVHAQVLGKGPWPPPQICFISWPQLSCGWVTGQQKTPWPPPIQPGMQSAAVPHRPPPWPFITNDTVVIFGSINLGSKVKSLFGYVVVVQGEASLSLMTHSPSKHVFIFEISQLRVMVSYSVGVFPSYRADIWLETTRAELPIFVTWLWQRESHLTINCSVLQRYSFFLSRNGYRALILKFLAANEPLLECITHGICMLLTTSWTPTMNFEMLSDSILLRPTSLVSNYCSVYGMLCNISIQFQQQQAVSGPDSLHVYFLYVGYGQLIIHGNPSAIECWKHWLTLLDSTVQVGEFNKKPNVDLLQSSQVVRLHCQTCCLVPGVEDVVVLVLHICCQLMMRLQQANGLSLIHIIFQSEEWSWHDWPFYLAEECLQVAMKMCIALCEIITSQSTGWNATKQLKVYSYNGEIIITASNCVQARELNESYSLSSVTGTSSQVAILKWSIACQFSSDHRLLQEKTGVTPRLKSHLLIGGVHIKLLIDAEQIGHIPCCLPSQLVWYFNAIFQIWSNPILMDYTSERQVIALQSYAHVVIWFMGVVMILLEFWNYRSLTTCTLRMELCQEAKVQLKQTASLMFVVTVLNNQLSKLSLSQADMQGSSLINWSLVVQLKQRSIWFLVISRHHHLSHFSSHIRDQLPIVRNIRSHWMNIMYLTVYHALNVECIGTNQTEKSNLSASNPIEGWFSTPSCGSNFFTVRYALVKLASTYYTQTSIENPILVQQKRGGIGKLDFYILTSGVTSITVNTMISSPISLLYNDQAVPEKCSGLHLVPNIPENFITYGLEGLLSGYLVHIGEHNDSIFHLKLLMEHTMATSCNIMVSDILISAMYSCQSIQFLLLQVCAPHTSMASTLHQVTGIFIFILHFYCLVIDDP